jgi:hypothetical protein
MSKNTTALSKLIELLKARRITRVVSSSDDQFIRANETLVSDLVRLANEIQPDPGFVKRISSQLARVAGHAPTTIAPSPRQISLELPLRLRMRKVWIGSALAFGILLILGATIAPSVIAQLGLEHFTPVEVETLAMSPESIAIATVPADARSRVVQEVETTAGFAVLQPTYLPDDCLLETAYFLAEPIAEIHLEYSRSDSSPCFDVAQRETSANEVHSPQVGPGSLEEVIVKGQPAILINGIWFVEDIDRLAGDDGIVEMRGTQAEQLFAEATWIGENQQLIFEYSGLLIRLSSGWNMTKEELIRIADSMEFNY